jgi:hypothetical protein
MKKIVQYHRRRSLWLQGIVALLIPFLALLTIWFAFFAIPTLDPQLSATNHGNHALYHYNQFDIKASNGKPAPDAVVTIGEQQRVSDQNGRVYFDHLMHAWYEAVIYHNGQHYKQLLPVSSVAANITLPLVSIQFSRFMAVSCALVLLGLVAWAVSQNYRRPKRPLGLVFAVTVLGLTTFSVVPLISAPVVAQANANGTIIDSLATPDKVKVAEDDNNAIVTWNGGPLKPDEKEEDAVTGYRITWGIAGQPLANVLLTQFRIAQLQPLMNGKDYEMQIQAVDNKGNLSPPTAPLKFTGNRDRVDKVRAQMNGFFDDFNLPPGNGNELNWNNAYSFCNDPELSSFFINTQYHAHNTVYADNCDRGQSISRARQMFDFTNRTGTVTFDFDGSFLQDVWYLDFVPSLTDITGHVHLEVETEQSSPTNTLRIRQNNQRLDIIWINGQGFGKTLATTDFNPYPELEWLGLNLVPNVRRHWEVKLNTKNIEVFVEGKKVIAANIDLPFSKSHLLWTQFAYSSGKVNQPYSMIHWDNFGFDAPAGFKPSLETHNYPTTIPGGGDMIDIEGSAKANLVIPDPITGNQTTERLLFTMQPWVYDYEWKDSDNVVVNGKQFQLPKPDGSVPAEKIIGAITPYTVVLDLPKGTLKQGENSLEFNLYYNKILNIHAEIDYPVGTNNSYTQPNLIKLNAGTGIPVTMPDVGPSARITGFNNEEIYIASSAGNNTDVKYRANGVLELVFEVDNITALRAHGRNPGLSRIEVMVDKQVVFRDEVASPPGYKGRVKIDTTQFGNGVHALFVQAFNPYGTISIPDYYDGEASQGDYFPIYVEFNNSNPSQSFKPLPSVNAIVPPAGNISATGNGPRPTAKPNAPAPTTQANAGNSSNTPVNPANGNALPPQTAEIPANRQPDATSRNLSVTWLYILGGAVGGLYLATGLLIWGGVRKRLTTQNRTVMLPLISLDYMLIWPLYLVTGKLRKKN